ncbi:MAG TPA: ATP-binding protein [Candidatus Acidoferrales bacterium]|nr:ATP-binding protein [Candidatus Acidoferrales bacterium]
MTRETIGASLSETSLPATSSARIGLINPATRFRKLLPYAGTALVMVIAIAGSATMKGMATSRDWLAHTYRVKSALGELEINRALMHEIVNAGPRDAATRERLEPIAKTIQQTIAELKDLTSDDPTQLERVEQLQPLLEEDVRNDMAASTTPEKPVRARATPEGGNAAADASISRIVGAINTEQTQVLGERQAMWDRDFHRNIAVLAFAVGACVLLLFANMHLLREDVRSTQVAMQHISQSADSYRALSARIIGLQDAERRRIGRELHDSVGQSLGALQMNVEQLANAREDSRAALLEETRDLVKRTAQEVRTISQLLHPPLLDVVGFVAAAKNYAQQFMRRSGIEVKVNFPEDFRLSSKEAELMLFRVLQESLTNVHRHAQATTVDVWLARHPHEIVLTVQDNGRGLPLGVIENFQAGMASGVGLAGMRERLAEFGGRLQVESSHSGTIVRAAIPI